VRIYIITEILSNFKLLHIYHSAIVQKCRKYNPSQSPLLAGVDDLANLFQKPTYRRLFVPVATSQSRSSQKHSTSISTQCRSTARNMGSVAANPFQTSQTKIWILSFTRTKNSTPAQGSDMYVGFYCKKNYVSPENALLNRFLGLMASTPRFANRLPLRDENISHQDRTRCGISMATTN